MLRSRLPARRRTKRSQVSLTVEDGLDRIEVRGVFGAGAATAVRAAFDEVASLADAILLDLGAVTELEGTFDLCGFDDQIRRHCWISGCQLRLDPTQLRTHPPGERERPMLRQDTNHSKTSTERPTVRATIDGVLLADADTEHILSIEGSRYFPPDSLLIGTLKESPTPYVCPWKGRARYYSVETPHHEYVNAAWCYPHPKRSAIETVGHDFTGYVAFDTTRVTVE